MMKLPKPTPAPKPKHADYLIFTYMYGLILLVLAVWQLVSVGLLGWAPFVVVNMPLWLTVLAAIEVFALPFLFMLTLSPPARASSAVLALAAPFAILGGLVFQMLHHPAANYMAWYVASGIALAVLGVTSFIVLDGVGAVRKCFNK